MEWMILSEHNLPQQGLKVLCFRKGDCWTAYRYNYKGESFWIPCIPYESINPHRKYRFVTCEEPEYWCHIPFESLPGDYKGLMYVKVEEDKELINFDDFEKKYPNMHADFMETFLWKLKD